MAPKKGKDEPAAPPPPTDNLGIPEFSDEALAAENFACDPPFEDEAGCRLPPNLYAGMVTWKRPSEFLGELLADGETTPCVVQAPPAAEDGTVPPLGRALPNVLSSSDVAAEASPSVQWLASCYQLVALQAELLDEGTFLWELIYPKGDDGLPAYQAGGKYAVKLWEQGAWRLIVVDDRMPVGSSNELLAPTSTSPLELWPLLLAKALYKLAEPYAISVSQDPAVLLRLTGWLPELMPITPTLPAEAAYEALAYFLPAEKQCALGVMLPLDADESLAGVGLHHGPLVAVRDVRTVDGSMYIRLETELMKWSGGLCDTDEATWTPSLASSLDWKRLQRLRKHAAGWPLHDFWLSLDSLNAHFSSIVILHRPGNYASVVKHVGEATGLGAAPTLLHVPASEEEGAGDAPVLLSLSARPLIAAEEPPAEGDEAPPAAPPAAPFGTCVLSVAKSEWDAPYEPPVYLRLPVSSASTISLNLARGATYQLTPMAMLPAGYGVEEVAGYEPAAPAEEEPVEAAAEAAEEPAAEATEEAAPAEEAAPPPAPEALPCHFSLVACCASDIFLGDVSKIATEQLGLRVLTLDGTTPEVPADEWSVCAAVHVKPSEACALSARLTFADGVVASCARLHFIGEDTKEEFSFLALASGRVEIDPAANPSGYILFADIKSPAPLPPSAWSVQLQSSAELETKILETKSTSLADAYPPNEAYTLFRLVVSTADKDKCTGSLHVTCTDPKATINVQAISLVGDEPPVVVSSASGLGCATLMAVGVEPPPPPPGKGQDPIPATVLIVEGSIDRLSALELGVATKPAPPPAEPAEGEEALPAGLGWSVTAVSAGTLTLAKDTAREEELKALSASWEAAAPGRAVKAKESRDKYLSDIAPPPPPEEGEEGAADETAAAPAPVETAALSNVTYKSCTSVGDVGVVWAPEEKEAWKAQKQGGLEELAAKRTAEEEARAAIRDSMSAKSSEIIAETKAKRAEKAEAYAAFVAEREALLTKLLPEPPAAAEPDKGKGKKK